MTPGGKLLVLVPVLVGAMYACAGSAGGEIVLPTQAEGASINLTAIARGTLVADDTRGCVYLRDESGGLTWLVWPPGYRAVGDPFEIRDATGKTVAKEGDTVDVGGGMGPAPDGPCDVGSDWWAVNSVLVRAG